MKSREPLTTPQFANVSSRGRKWPRSVELEMALEQRAIGRRIAELREDRRLTQPVMAERVGVSLRGYQKWEAGTAAPNWRNLEQLAEALGVTADDLIGAGETRHEPVSITLARIETTLEVLQAELATIRVEAAAADARLTKELRSVRRLLEGPAKGKRSQPGG